MNMSTLYTVKAVCEGGTQLYGFIAVQMRKGVLEKQSLSDLSDKMKRLT